jgi:hypothetical protein
LQIYKNLTDLDEIGSTVSPGYYDFMSKSKLAYEEALTSLPNPEPPEEYKGGAFFCICCGVRVQF